MSMLRQELESAPQRRNRRTVKAERNNSDLPIVVVHCWRKKPAFPSVPNFHGSLSPFYSPPLTTATLPPFPSAERISKSLTLLP